MSYKSTTASEESNLMDTEYPDASLPWNFWQDPWKTLKKHQP